MKYLLSIFFILLVGGSLAYYMGWLERLGLNKMEAATDEEPAISPSPSFSNAVPVDVYILRAESLENKINSTGTILPREGVSIRSEVAGIVTSISFNEGQRVKKNDLLVKLNQSELLAELKRLKQIIELRSEREKRNKLLLDQEVVSYEEYELIKAELDLAVNDADIIQAKINKTFIRAPFDGLLGFRRISKGAYLSPEVEITQLLNIDTVLVEFSVPSKYSKRIHLGKSIHFTTQSSIQPRRGTLYVRQPFIDSDTRMLTIRAFVVNRSHALLPGQFANISLVLDTYNDALMVPAEAVIPGEQGNSVYLVKNGQAESRPLEIGTRTNKRIHVLSGLEEGDSLIVTGLLRVFPGAKLDINQID